jgi:pimeloyl-ACP methyl ester carboxylesterase
MRSLSRTFFLLGLVLLALAMLPGNPAFGQGKKADTKDVSFKTYDGVELKGTLYPNTGGKREAAVILLHDFSHKQGGGRSKDNWPDLAASLQEDGYVVLAFDFRGFGESKNVNKEKFWKFRHNTQIKGSAKQSDTIDQKDFGSGYYQYLVNDIAAARAYLDRLNDQNSCNTSSVIVIGAGQGATLGALWMASEGRRKVDKNSGMGLLVAQPMLDDPESKDLAAGVFLTISPRLEGRTVAGPLQRWLGETVRVNKIPACFILGKTDSANDNVVNAIVKVIKGTGKAKSPWSTYRIEGTNLTGSKLLEKSLGTDKFIKKYLDSVMEKRGAKEWRKREVEKKAYYYVIPGRRLPVINKPAGQEVPPVDLNQFLGGI